MNALREDIVLLCCCRRFCGKRAAAGGLAFATALAAGLIVLGGIGSEETADAVTGTTDGTAKGFHRVVALIDEPLQLRATAFDRFTELGGCSLEVAKAFLRDVVEEKRGMGVPDIRDLLCIAEDRINRC